MKQPLPAMFGRQSIALCGVHGLLLFLAWTALINTVCAVTLIPTPPDGATWMYREGDLLWEAEAPPGPMTTYKVYLGTDADLVAAGDSSVYQGNTSATIYHPPNPLTLNQCYYWRIDAGASMGPLWKFYVPGLLNPVPTGMDPAIGGRSGYADRCDDSVEGAVVVTTRDQFLEALACTDCGTRIVIPDIADDTNPVEIDLTEVSSTISIPAGILLCGQRGKPPPDPNAPSLPGALLYTNRKAGASLFAVDGPGVRISGLRITGSAEYNEMRGIAVGGSNLQTEIDNCEVAFFGYANIFSAEDDSTIIHHNFIHFEKDNGFLTYGVEIRKGFVDIFANVFDGGRHPIAGSGGNDCSYQARYNIFLSGVDNNHQVDMHGQIYFQFFFWTIGTGWCWQWCLRFLPCWGCQAGNSIDIHHNTFAWPSQPHNAIGIRGQPNVGAEIYENWFFHNSIDDAVRQRYLNQNVFVRDNVLGFDFTETCDFEPEQQGSWTNFYRWFI